MCGKIVKGESVTFSKGDFEGGGRSISVLCYDRREAKHLN